MNSRLPFPLQQYRHFLYIGSRKCCEEQQKKPGSPKAPLQSLTLRPSPSSTTCSEYLVPAFSKHNGLLYVSYRADRPYSVHALLSQHRTPSPSVYPPIESSVDLEFLSCLSLNRPSLTFPQPTISDLLADGILDLSYVAASYATRCTWISSPISTLSTLSTSSMISRSLSSLIIGPLQSPYNRPLHSQAL